MFFSNRYNKKFLVQCCLWLLAVMGLMKVTGGTGYIVCVPMIFWALAARKAEELFFWLLLAVSMLMCNHVLAPKNIIFMITQRGLMLFLGLMMTIRIAGTRNERILRPFTFMFAYILFMIIPSSFGWSPLVSFLKLLLFTMIYFAYFGISNEVSINPRTSTAKLRSAMLAPAMFFVFGSVLLIPFPGISMMNAEELLKNPDMSSLFKGMTMHSQSLGPIVSVLAVTVLADMLFSVKHYDPLYISILACCPLLIYKTSSRTGMGAFVLGIVYTVWLFSRARGIPGRWKGRVVNAMMILGLAGGVVLVALPSGRAGISRFLLKGHSDRVSVEGVMNTRQFIIDRQLENFKKSPLLGHGFQVDEEMEGEKRNSLKEILSAPIEKGVWVTAVLEEGGIAGWLIFAIFLLTCIVGSAQRKAYIGSSSLFVVMMTNLGEFTFFSMSYTGGFCWAMVFAGLAMDAQRLREEGRWNPGFMPPAGGYAGLGYGPGYGPGYMPR